MKQLTVVPFAGLCNRLNAIVCALQFKKLHPDVHVEIFWFKYYHCNCKFGDIFKPLPSCFIQVQELRGFKNRPGTKFNFGIPDKFRSLWYDYSITPAHHADKFYEYTKGKERVFVYKDNRFCPSYPDGMLSKYFRPVDEIQLKIDEITKDWMGDVVGLHIRRTDNVHAIQNTPMSYFYGIIEKELRLNPNIRFYLATDDENVKQDLKERYGIKTIISANITLKRNSLQGMKDAVLDLYCLASTARIYGSAASTYTMFASKIFDKELFLNKN